ncbi:hypothetical protein C7T94_06110 [Pedobacter yulinensis]|uniref:NADPH-dependent FMN reductase-like domain-containing protein n=1 Tax=Pedobacter yulinensis TaxID=2126353 RepID=A0A2T3HPA3_9SPHI|nr:NAD(P)H-dependent oxidoreductase [Pedobacter yulinensis]PST84290.1 hypothetical protein C7T94_06110 [Pedobacter yulinensis]
MYQDIKNKGRILFFSGSNHSVSINQMVVAYLAQMIGGDLAETLQLKRFPAPLYAQEDEQAKGIPETISELINLLDQFDSFVIAVPENNGSVTAFFKNTLDWLSRARKSYRVFQDKKIFLIAVSPGNGGHSAIRHAGDILKRLGATILGERNVRNFDASQFNAGIEESSLHSELQELAYSVGCHFNGKNTDR